MQRILKYGLTIHKHTKELYLHKIHFSQTCLSQDCQTLVQIILKYKCSHPRETHRSTNMLEFCWIETHINMLKFKSNEKFRSANKLFKTIFPRIGLTLVQPWLAKSYLASFHPTTCHKTTHCIEISHPPTSLPNISHPLPSILKCEFNDPYLF